MPSYVPAKKNTAFVVFVALESQAAAGTFKTSPTLAAGDFKVSIDGGALANLATLPTNTPAASAMVKISLSASEMNGDNITVVCTDAAGAEWYDLVLNIQTSARQIDDLSTLGGTAQTGDAYARLTGTVEPAIADVPTVAEFNARTLAAAAYFDPAADTVANVTTVATVTNLTNAPTAGDLTATMKTSVTTAATAATPTAAAVTAGVDVASISGDTVAADNLEAMLDGTRAKLYLSQLNIVATGNDAALMATGSGAGQGALVTGGATASGLKITTNSTVAGVSIDALNGHGISVAAGKVGLNLYGNDADGGHSAIDIYNNGTSADAVRIDHLGGGKAINIRGSGSQPAIEVHNYGTGQAAKYVGGDTSGDAVLYQTTDGHGVNFSVAGAGKNDINTDELGGGSGLTAQQTRDAMMLAPTAGAPAAGSVDAHLDDILEDTGTTLPASIAAISQIVDNNTTDATTAGSITRRRGDSWAIQLTVGSIVGYTSLWFTARGDRDAADTASVVQVRKNASGLTDGLLYVNGAVAATAGLGSITVSDAATGAIIITIDEAVTDDLSPAEIYYDVQVLISGNVTTLDLGTLTITADVTRAIL